MAVESVKANSNEAANIVRDELLFIDEKGARDQILATVSRVFFYQDVELARLIIRRHQAAKEHISVSQAGE
eukprot:8218930-Karenia_brevis.AAC.1